MARRIVTAREQHEMLSPWRMAQKLYRGISVNLSQDFYDQFGPNPAEHPDFGTKLVDQITRGYHHDGGLGTHFSSSPEVARNYARGGHGMPITIEVNWDGTGRDETALGGRNNANTFDGEDEVMLHPDHPVELSRVHYGPESREVWNKPWMTST